MLGEEHGEKKRDLSILTNRARSAILTWLYQKNFSACPFIDMTEDYCSVCKSLFPKLPYTGNPPTMLCPCDAYSTSYVVKMAKEFVK